MKVNKDNRVYFGEDLDSMANAKNYYKLIVNKFKSYIDGNILEVGSGSGTFTDYLRNKNVKKIYCVEPVEEMYKLHIKKNNKTKSKDKNSPKIQILHGFLSERLNQIPNDIDCAIYTNVLEHVEKDIEELKLVSQKLKKNGYVCIFVPALPFLYSKFDEKVGHYRRYTKKSLKDVLQKAGFEVVKAEYFDIIGIIPWIINFKLLGKIDLNPKSVKLYDNIVVPHMNKIEGWANLPFGKNVLAVGKWNK